MSNPINHTVKTLTSSIEIKASRETIWSHITNVHIDQFSEPAVFRILGIPKPLSAEIISEGKNGMRIACFDNGKKFVQKILIWNPYVKYSFSFNPEKGFRVLYAFDISDGIFRILYGNYQLKNLNGTTTLKLSTTYSIDKRLSILLNIPVTMILRVFQKHLLESIIKNAE